MTYDDAVEWIEIEFDPDDFLEFDNYIDAIRFEFDNSNLIDAIQDDLEDVFSESFDLEPLIERVDVLEERIAELEEQQRIESNIEAFFRRIF